jgi:hypothetical protein
MAHWPAGQAQRGPSRSQIVPLLAQQQRAGREGELLMINREENLRLRDFNQQLMEQNWQMKEQLQELQAYVGRMEEHASSPMAAGQLRGALLRAEAENRHLGDALQEEKAFRMMDINNMELLQQRVVNLENLLQKEKTLRMIGGNKMEQTNKRALRFEDLLQKEKSARLIDKENSEKNIRTFRVMDKGSKEQSEKKITELENQLQEERSFRLIDKGAKEQSEKSCTALRNNVKLLEAELEKAPKKRASVTVKKGDLEKLVKTKMQEAVQELTEEVSQLARESKRRQAVGRTETHRAAKRSGPPTEATKQQLLANFKIPRISKSKTTGRGEATARRRLSNPGLEED